MTVALNGFEIVRAVGDNPSVFAHAREQVQKAALSIVGAQLKCKMLDLPKVGEVRKALGAATFTLLLEHLSEKPLAAITRKIDPHCSDQNGAASTWHRNHIDALASGRIVPAEKPVRSFAKKKAAASKKRKAGLRVTEDNFYPASMAEAVGSRKK
jgi:hypothetical protein